LITHLTTRELDVLSSLWNSEKPMTMTDIVKSQHDLTQGTVNAVLKKLMSLELIEITGSVRSGKTMSRTYVPKAASKDFVMQYLSDSYSKFDKVISKSDFLVALLKNNGNAEQSKDEVKHLKKMLDEFERLH
jgi:predicted transcriptional regulator